MRSLVHVLFIPFVLTSPALTNGSIASSDSADLDSIKRMLHVTDELAILARLVNGIALSQGLTDGSVKMSSIVRELLHLGPNITLDTLISEDVPGLVDDLKAVATALNAECGGQRGCGYLDPLAAGLRVLENMEKAVGEMDRILANTTFLGQAVEVVRILEKFETQINRTRYIATEINQVLIKHVWMYREFTDEFDDFTNDCTFLMSLLDTLKQEGIIDDISVMLKIENVLKTASSDQKTVVKMRNVLEETNKTLGVLRSVLSKNAVGVINGKLHSLGQLIKSQSEVITKKTETSGLFNGFDDLNGYLRDLDTNFVTVTVGNRQTIENLISLLNPVIKLSEQLMPLQKSWGALRLEQTTDSVELMQKELDAAAQEMDSSFANIIVSIPSIKDCFSDISLEEELDVDSWKNIQEQMNNFDVLLSDYRTKIPSPGTLFNSSEHALVFREFVRNGSNFDEYVRDNELDLRISVTALTRKFATFRYLKFGDYIVDSSIANIPTMEAEWLNRSGIEKALKCLKDNPALTSSNFFNASLAALQKLNSSSVNWKPILTASSTLKLPLEDWKKINTSSSRSVRSVSQLRDARMLSQELSSGVKVIRDLAEVYKKRRAIKKLVDEQDSIDKEVNGLTDPNQKREVENVWTTETKAELKSLVEKIGQLAQTIDESPGKITDFASVFEKFEKFDFPSIDTRKLKSTLSFLKKPPGIQDTLDVIGDLDLNFVRAKRRLQIASGTLPSLMTFLDGFLNITKRVSSTTSSPTVIPIVPANPPAPPPQAPVASALTATTSDSEPFGFWTILSISLIVLLVASAIGNMGFVYVYVYGKKIKIGKQNKESEADKTEKKLRKATEDGKDNGKEEKKQSSLEADLKTQPLVSSSSVPDQLATTPSTTALTPTQLASAPSRTSVMLPAGTPPPTTSVQLPVVMAQSPAAMTPPPAPTAQSPAAPNTGTTGTTSAYF